MKTAESGVWHSQSDTVWCPDCQRYRINCAHLDRLLDASNTSVNDDRILAETPAVLR